MKAIAWEATAAIRAKLYAGTDEIDMKGEGAHLSAAECGMLLSIIMGDLKLRRPAGRKAKINHEFRDDDIAMLFALYRAKGFATKIAVAKCMEVFGVKRDTVYAARRLHPHAFDWDANWRDGTIAELEWAWRRKSGET